MPALKAALLGKRLDYSLSGPLHELLFPMLRHGVDSEYDGIVYELQELPTTEAFTSWLGAAASNGYHAANVTNPYKQEAARRATERVGDVRQLESGNTLKLFADRTVVASTDGRGFLHALTREIAHFDLSHYHFYCLGAGATAKAILYSMLNAWMPLSFTIVARDLRKADALMSFIGASQPGPSLQVCTIDAVNQNPRPDEPCVVLNATPVGQLGEEGNLLDQFQWSEYDIALDVVYNPAETPFLARAEEEGARVMNGLGMLVEQAALAQYFWLTNEFKLDSPLTFEQHFELKAKLAHLVEAHRG